MDNILYLIGGYLVACVIAWTLHEAAHYAVHGRYAESVTVGLNRKGPYVDAVYKRTAPTLAIRIGSIAPTLFYTPLVVLGIMSYLQMFSVPTLTPLNGHSSSFHLLF